MRPLGDSRVTRGILMRRISVLIKRDMREMFCLDQVKVQQKCTGLQTRKTVLTRHQICWDLDLRMDLPASRSVRDKYSLFKPPSLWCFCYSSPNGLRQNFPLLHDPRLPSPPGTCAAVLQGRRRLLLSQKSCLFTSAVSFPAAGIRSPLSKLLS